MKIAAHQTASQKRQTMLASLVGITGLVVGLLAYWNFQRSKRNAKYKAQQHRMDATLEASFPASDPPSWTTASAGTFH